MTRAPRPEQPSEELVWIWVVFNATPFDPPPSEVGTLGNNHEVGLERREKDSLSFVLASTMLVIVAATSFI